MANFSARRVYWATQQTVTDLIPSATNTAGSQDLATEGVLVCGKKTRNQTLIWSTTDIWVATYIGGDFVYSFTQAGMNCGIMSARAAVVLDTGAYWMGIDKKFFVYDGFVKTIPCDVTDYVFGDFNLAVAASVVWAFANPAFNEITWFYPSGASSSADKYVTYNYVEDHWVFGTLQRSAGVTRFAGGTNPILITSSGQIYDHESGNTRSATAYLESGPLEVDEGDRVARVQRIVPDDETMGNVTVSLYTSMYPDAAETLNGPYTVTSPTSVRLTARQVRLRIVEAAASAWRVGIIRLGAIMGERR